MIEVGTGPTAEPSDELTLVQIVRKTKNKESRESTWARRLGGNRYEIKGPLHLISGLNSGDIVEAVMLPDHSLPVVLKVLRRSGYKMLHIAFSKDASLVHQQIIIENLGKWGATHQLAFERFYTIEINPQGDYQAACDYLKSMEPEGLLSYEPSITLDALLRLRLTGFNYD